ncbi:MAG TPA: hypothetical protein VFM10_07360 [Terriglobales bacterium]|nr:hypothetical protein [Terriglobales bacterium]
MAAVLPHAKVDWPNRIPGAATAVRRPSVTASRAGTRKKIQYGHM